MAKTGKTGVTSNTPKNILFGAGTIHKNLVYSGGSWNFLDSIIGATNGGSKFSIVPEIKQVEVDGALVAAKGLTLKTGEKATLEINIAEITQAIIESAVIGETGTSADENYNVIESKADIEAGDYLTNIAFVGKKLDGTNVIVILDNALCTSGFENDNKNKEGSVPKLVFECHADLDSDLDTLPWHIYYPVASA